VGVVTRAYRMAIDDWYADPDNWSYETYMPELLTVPNRGFTLAFHDGRLQNYAHNYEDTHSLGEYEFAGFVTEAGEDYLDVEVKNRILAGDVLEFVCPGYRDTIRLRLYHFISAADGERREAVHPGQNFRFRIPFAAFDREDPRTLRDRLPPLTLVRKERILREDEWRRLQLDREAGRIELGEGSQARYEQKRRQLIAAMQESAPLPRRAPKTGAEGCCGKGCNGCLIFAHDARFAAAREALRGRKMGEKLS